MKTRGFEQSKLNPILALFKIGWLLGCLITVFQLILDITFGFLIQSSLAPISIFSIAKSIGLTIGHFLILLLFTKDLIYGYQLKNKDLNNWTLALVLILGIINIFIFAKYSTPFFSRKPPPMVYESIPWTTLITTLMLVYAYFGLIYLRFSALKKSDHEKVRTTR